MNSDDDLEKMYAELEARYGDSLEEKSAEAFRQSTKKRLSVEVITDSENNPLRVSLTFGPHHFVVVGMADEKCMSSKVKPITERCTMPQRLGVSGNR